MPRRSETWGNAGNANSAESENKPQKRLTGAPSCVTSMADMLEGFLKGGKPSSIDRAQPRCLLTCCRKQVANAVRNITIATRFQDESSKTRRIRTD